MRQLQLPIPAEPLAPQSRREAMMRPEQAAMADLLPRHVHLGVVGFPNPAWAGVLWEQRRPLEDLERDGLLEYFANPLLTTVALDPGDEPSERDLIRIAAQLPRGVRCPVLAGPSVTLPRLPRSGTPRREDRRAGVRPNPRFLEPYSFLREFLPTVRACLGERLGPVMLVFPPGLGLSPELFVERLERFVPVLPDTVDWAIELRDPSLFTPAYAQLLAASRIAHVFTSWPGMPSLAAQRELVASQATTLVHLCAPARDDGELTPRDEVREEVVTLLGSLPPAPAYVLSNDALEGSAPLTLFALARGLVASSAARAVAAPSPRAHRH